ncbi:hypothetical protein [Streptomyces sp. JB150]|uniref:hypothetical protein n=1 Tax=Streptomyces sp. JB150 TaxID=2714844 RepID=UPI00140C2AC0|nr:hypothetical protein [Streptomyces sp. JB150]QIJ61444.1 hypothetical protein G7Z13_04880 [Streptomyces sp. JB150]
MTQQTPADELREAAEKLRSLITFLGDNRGPWEVDTPPSGYPQSINNVGVPYLVANTYEGPGIPAFTIAPYIATMHPGVGAALAKLLRDTHAFHEHDDRPDHGGCDWCGDEDWPCSDVRNALAVARAVLGRPAVPAASEETGR